MMNPLQLNLEDNWIEELEEEMIEKFKTDLIFAINNSGSFIRCLQSINGHAGIIGIAIGRLAKEEMNHSFHTGNRMGMGAIIAIANNSSIAFRNMEEERSSIEALKEHTPYIIDKIDMPEPFFMDRKTTKPHTNRYVQRAARKSKW